MRQCEQVQKSFGFVTRNKIIQICGVSLMLLIFKCWNFFVVPPVLCVKDSLKQLSKYIKVSWCQRWGQGRNAGGAKIAKVPAASEASKIFTDHSFLIG